MSLEADSSGGRRLRLGHRDDVGVNSAKRICLGHRAIALFNIGGRLYATDDTCTHGPASLAEEGIIEGDYVECALHGGQFHIPTGKPVRYPPHIPLIVYDLEIAPDGDVYIRF